MATAAGAAVAEVIGTSTGAAPTTTTVKTAGLVSSPPLHRFSVLTAPPLSLQSCPHSVPIHRAAHIALLRCVHLLVCVVVGGIQRTKVGRDSQLLIVSLTSPIQFDGMEYDHRMVTIPEDTATLAE
jgi:hypothetical protein